MHASVAPAERSVRDVAADLSLFTAHLLRQAGDAGWLQVVDEAELSLTQLKALVALRVDQELTVKDLAAALSLSLPATSRAVDGLFHRGLVERREDEQDRRMKRVRLSETGRVVLARIAQARIAGIEAFVETLTPDERRSLTEGLAPILAHCTPAAAQDRAS